MNSNLDEFGRSELHYAANEADIEKCRSLIDDGADVNLADNNSWTPLHFAAQSGSIAVAKVLLEAGAAVDALDANGNTPLWRATFESDGSGDMIELLRSLGANPTKDNASGVSPVRLARTIANYGVAQFYADLPE